MRFLIVGAGGIGAYYGARLIEAGHRVVFVARGEHLRAMGEQGLRVSHPEFEFAGPVEALDQARLIGTYGAGDFDLILLTVKAGATESVMAFLHDWLAAAATPVLSLQNGVENESIIESHVGRDRTIGGLAVRIGGHITQPGCIEATGVAQVVMGVRNTFSSTGPRKALPWRMNIAVALASPVVIVVFSRLSKPASEELSVPPVAVTTYSFPSLGR